ncbi:hypothetical protein CR513_55751, partial [Mucuna pruriens]
MISISFHSIQRRKIKRVLCRIVALWLWPIIEQIWDVNYTKFRVSVYKRVDSIMGAQTNELGFTLVDLHKVGYKGESFIMASHAKQVFYVNHPSCKMSMHGSDMYMSLAMII